MLHTEALTKEDIDSIIDETEFEEIVKYTEISDKLKEVSRNSTWLPQYAIKAGILMGMRLERKKLIGKKTGPR